jgi:hypothetical protein
MLNCFCISWDCNCFWAAITAIATIALVFVGCFQLQELNKTNREAFLQKLKNDFFTENERRLMFLIENGFLKFESIQINETESYHLFVAKIPDNYLPYLTDAALREKKYYMTQEVDDFLLQHFEDLGLLYKKGILKKYEIEQTFGYYLETCWKSEEIQKYLHFARGGDEDIYSKFKLICSVLNYN